MPDKIRIFAVLLMLSGAALWGQDPFGVTAELTAGPPPTVNVRLTIPASHYLYVHMLSVRVDTPTGVTLTARAHPKPKTKFDELLEETVSYYDHDTTLAYEVSGLQGTRLTLSVGYQGCDATTCFLPQNREFALDTTAGRASAPLSPETHVTSPAETEGEKNAWLHLAGQFKVMGTGTGYMNSKDFLEFITQSEEGTAPQGNLLQTVFDRFGIGVALLILIPLGLLLNLTPCVLPMIPINLAIIGAGNAAGTKRTGFTRGLAYGAGMALVYGILGLIVVLTGSQFGALNASPWFNLAIALVFVALGLAMFDVFVIDLSRFQRSTVGSEKSASSPYVTAFLLGGTAALLAGACVAPVLIWVLVLATDLYTKGNVGGLLLPFMLGVGMALPWPIAGAGMAVLPRPGAWMNTVKHGFGVLILLFALYYATLGVRLFIAAAGYQGDKAPQDQGEAGWIPDLKTGLKEASLQRKPVFIDFWALSCKSCMKMKKTTFKDPIVTTALEGYVKIALQTDDAHDPVIQGALEYYGVLGLPTYVVMKPLK